MLEINNPPGYFDGRQRSFLQASKSASFNATRSLENAENRSLIPLDRGAVEDHPRGRAAMAGFTSNEDRIRTEFATLIDNFTNLIRASKVQDPSLDQAVVPGEMLELFAEKMLAACRALLAITSELKRTALLNDVETRNAEVRATIRQYNSETLHSEERQVSPSGAVVQEESDVSIM